MMEYNLQKFINATLLFASRVKKLGITKLNKLLYYSDFEHYRLYGRPILGDRYIRMEHGPVPSISYSAFNANFTNEEDSSLKDAIAVRPETVISVNRKRIVPKREPDLSFFSPSEREVMEKIAERWREATAQQISTQSHIERPWRETPELEVIDYKLALEGPDSISREYIQYREQEDKELESVLLTE